MDFGGEGYKLTLGGKILYCPKKGAYVLVDKVKEFAVTREKIWAGWMDTPTGVEDLIMSEDENYVHIGCLKETKEDFRKKYVELIKMVNNGSK